MSATNNADRTGVDCAACGDEIYATSGRTFCGDSGTTCDSVNDGDDAALESHENAAAAAGWLA